MNHKNFGQKRQTITKEKRLEKIHYRILIGLMVIGVVQYYFFDPTTIGHDNRYTLYVFLLPTIIGILALAFYRKDFLLHKLTISENLIGKFLIIIFYLVQGFLFSFLSIGLISKLTFNYINNDIAKQNQTEIITCEITRFWTGRRPSIDFKYDNRHDKFRVNYNTIKEYEDKQPDDYKLEITARKGLWNYYKVDDWTIKNIR